MRVVSDVSVLCPRRGVQPDNKVSSLWKIRVDLHAGIQAELNHHPEIVTGGVVIDDLPIPQLVPLDVLDLEPFARWLDAHEHPPLTGSVGSSSMVKGGITSGAAAAYAGWPPRCDAAWSTFPPTADHIDSSCSVRGSSRRAIRSRSRTRLKNGASGALSAIGRLYETSGQALAGTRRKTFTPATKSASEPEGSMDRSIPGSHWVKRKSR